MIVVRYDGCASSRAAQEHLQALLDAVIDGHVYAIHTATIQPTARITIHMVVFVANVSRAGAAALAEITTEDP